MPSDEPPSNLVSKRLELGILLDGELREFDQNMLVFHKITESQNDLLQKLLFWREFGKAFQLIDLIKIGVMALIKHLAEEVFLGREIFID
ncbi:hypothetical protein D3C73_1436340 [compost metagenome]